MSNSRVTVGLGLGLLLPAPAAEAGAWTLDAGTGQVLLTGTATVANRAFDESRSLQDTPRYRKLELQGLVEYGITDQFTAIVSPGLQHVDIAPPVDAQRTGLGYSEFGGRYRFLQGDSWVLSGQATLRVPGTQESANPAAIGYTDIEADVRALFGYSFALGPMPAFVDLQLAQRFRAAAPPDELRADLTFGLRPFPSWLILAQSLNVISEGASPPFPSFNYHKLQLSAVYALTPDWALQLGGVTTFAGRNALQENGVVMGVWYKF